MSMFVDSLARLYATNRITKSKLDALLASKKITKQEYDYITSGRRE